MSASPAKKSKANSGSDDGDADELVEGWTTLSVDVEHGDSFSPVIRLNGYPWRLRLHMVEDGTYELFLRCDKGTESELWKAEVAYRIKGDAQTYGFTFASHIRCSREFCIMHDEVISKRLEVDIWPQDNGNKWKCRPNVGPFAPRDGCLVIEDTKLCVNKESLAAQSSYFDRLFNGEFKEKTMAEIPIRNVSVEEFTNLLRMVYGENGASVVNDLLTRENIHRVLELADRFDLKIVEDGVVSTLLSSLSSFSIHERLLIAEQHGLTTCKDRIIAQYTEAQVVDLSGAPEHAQLSMETKDALFKKACEFLRTL